MSLAGPAPENLRALTTMRFGAAFWVVLFHYWPALSLAGLPGLVAKGYLGVELFFVLSGFILCHVYLRAAGEGGFRYGSFLWARLARVYPLHLATLIGVGVLAGAATLAGIGIDPNILSWSSLPANLLMVHAWGFAPQASWNHPSWSISAEWFAYLLFPLFALVFWKLRSRPRAALIISLAALMGTYGAFEALAGFPLTQATIHWGALRIVPCFALGCATYLAFTRMALPRPGLLAGLSTLAIIAASALHLWDGVIVSLFALLIWSLAALSRQGEQGAPPVRWLNGRVGVYLGEISYSVYMVCVPWKLLAVNAALRVFDRGDGTLPLLVWLLILACIPLIAAMTYHLIEKPSRRAMRDWAGHREARKSAITASDKAVKKPKLA